MAMPWPIKMHTYREQALHHGESLKSSARGSLLKVDAERVVAGLLLCGVWLVSWPAFAQQPPGEASPADASPQPNTPSTSSPTTNISAVGEVGGQQTSQASKAEATSGAAKEEPLTTQPQGQAKGDAEPAWERQLAVRRSGFTVGIALGGSISSAAGFPNDVKKLGLLRYYTETGVIPGAGGFLWIGGALSDWLTFGLGGGGGSWVSGDTTTSSTVLMFHVEAFPLFWRGGIWQDMGVVIDTGTGVAMTTRTTDDAVLIDGSAISRIAGGVFYEGIRLGKKISMGPWVYGDYSWSLSIRKPGLFLGWRTVLYTKP